MNHVDFVRGNNQVLHQLARTTQDLAGARRQWGFLKAEEKRNWSVSFEREFRASGNVTGSTRVADAETAPQTAERQDLEGSIAALEVERDFLVTLLVHDAD